MRFEELEINSKIIRAVTDMGFEEATPIQAKAIPVVLSGVDVIGQAQTGTGKTAAFGIPMLERIDPKDKHLRRLFFVRQENLRYRLPMKSESLQSLCTALKCCQSTAVRIL